MNTTTTVSLSRKLTAIAEEKKGIRSIVAQEALDYTSDNPKAFFNDLLIYGCVTGMISSLIYYCDTGDFYDKHYDEIEELRYEYKEMNGMQITIHGDYKNFMAWYSFEETAYRIYQELGLDD